MNKSIPMAPIGRVSSARSEPVDDAWDTVEAKVILDPTCFGPEATHLRLLPTTPGFH